MSKSKHPHGKGKKSISTTVPVEIMAALDHLAIESGITRSNYAREVIIQAVNAGRILSSRDIKRRERYSTPEVISLRAAENPIKDRPRRSAGA